MGETRVDLLHLLEDLRDAYPGPLEETILTEIVANALDSGASTVRITADPAQCWLTVTDDGSGMLRRELARYHDVASSGKTRGQGIGFAGVGIKLGLLISEEVVTETRRGKSHVATRWHLASRHKAPWKWVPAPGAVPARGTAVSLRLDNALSPLLDAGYIEAALRRHYLTLFDPAFEPILASQYPRGVRFEVNGAGLEPQGPPEREIAPIEVRLARKRKPSALGYLARDPLPLPEERRGVAVSTLGKVIRRGWEWLGLTPTAGECVGGVIEVPALAECLTLNKADFIRSGARGATYLAYRKAVQEVVARQLERWGDTPGAAEESRRRAARPVERDLERVLLDMADDFPLLASLVERREGGQGRLPIGRPGAPTDDARALVAAALGRAAEATAIAEDDAPAATEENPAAPAAEGSDEPSPEAAASGSLTLPAARGPRRPGRYGLTIQFERRPDDAGMARLVESCVWVNEAHPAFRRAAASRSEGYHLALAAAMALAPLAVEPAHAHAFVTAFLARWGEALEPAGRRSSRRG
ncbi:MAG: hypothetical protein A2W00_12510 [Candidatus Eisenbacteria bacterium RBG_16_71_46]|nr:MAG: hypothetical protein A2W00_12510 [Candidatus Eisenbacteria bacterium RBG_16_71_46]